MPHKKLFEKKAELKYLVRFGCMIFTVNNDPNRKKTDEKGVHRFMLCYTNTGYKVLDPKTLKVKSIKHARCMESKVYGDQVMRKTRLEKSR